MERLTERKENGGLSYWSDENAVRKMAEKLAYFEDLQEQWRIAEIVNCKDCTYSKATTAAMRVNGYKCTHECAPCRNRIVGPFDYCAHGEAMEELRRR